ncbi:MAG: glycosyl hydrolase [Blautia sp.]|nr:glycosyl hydrolase [Blautia sp.]
MSIVPNAPLFRDPVYDGAADPVIIWNRQEQAWWLLYTNRRAAAPGTGVSYMHGTDIGITSSADAGKTWIYRGILRGLDYEPGRNTYWAPEVIESDGIYHMYVSYVRGVPSDWNCARKILHYTSTDLWNWSFESELKLSSDKVIDACVLRLQDGSWKMWYKDEVHQSFTYTAYSKDLYHWEPGRAEITDCPHEGPNVFFFEGKYWMVTDPWEGIGVYVSEDACNWKRCSNILKDPGIRTDDGTIGNHADVLVHHGRAYIFYFTHPEVTLEQRKEEAFLWEYRHRRSSLQVAELRVSEGELICDRDHVEMDLSV